MLSELLNNSPEFIEDGVQLLRLCLQCLAAQLVDAVSHFIYRHTRLLIGAGTVDQEKGLGSGVAHFGAPSCSLR